MASGITFTSREEAKEYANLKRQEGYDVVLTYNPKSEEYVVSLKGRTSKPPIHRKAPKTIKEELAELEAETETARAGEEGILTEAEEEELHETKAGRAPSFRERQLKRRAKRYGPKGVLSTPPEELPERAKKKVVGIAKYTYKDIAGGLGKAKRPPHVMEGMLSQIPRTTGEHPRIGAEGAIGVRTPRIGIVSGKSTALGNPLQGLPRLGGNSLPTPQDSAIPKEAGFQTPTKATRFQVPHSTIAKPTSLVTKSVPMPKRVIPYLKKRREEQENEEPSSSSTAQT